MIGTAEYEGKGSPTVFQGRWAGHPTARKQHRSTQGTTMSPRDVKFNGSFALIKKKRQLFRDPSTVSQRSSTALPPRFPVSRCGNVGPASLLAILENDQGRSPGDPGALPAFIRGISPCLRAD